LLNLGREPSWRVATAALRRGLPDGLADWLIGTDSLTRRLQDECGPRFGVALRGQRWQRPLPGERAVLALPDRAYALVRHVHLLCAGQALVFGRTVMPATTLRGARRRYASLGSRPLGAVLFSDASVVRGAIEVARIAPGGDLHAAAFAGLDGGPSGAGPREEIWGRRSVFFVEGYPLLVSELFLPAIARPRAWAFHAG
jgi:chorismate--pyruvate lyase